MTTHLRARAVQAGAFLALVGGSIAVAASPAHAVPPTVTIDSVSSTNIKAGETIQLRYTVSSVREEPVGDVQITVAGMDCTGECSPELAEGKQQSFTANLTAGPVDAGKEKTVRVQVSARGEGGNAAANRNITVRGPEKPKQVRQISGRVKDSDGKAVSGAQVLMKDSAGHQYDTTSNGNGGYEFTSSDDRPITPGNISVGAAKEGYEPAAVNVRASADKTVTVALTLVSKNAPSPSASPSATEKPSAEALADEDDAADDATEAPAIDPNAASNNSDSGSGAMLFIILGGLLVAAGIGAIVLVLMRRKDNGDDDPDGLAKPGGVVPPSQGRFADDATRVAAPVGGRANDATMIAGMGAGPSLSDAPTMLQRAVPADDEFPDPYGAPPSPPQAGAYGAPPPAGGYAPGGYDEGYGAAAPPTGYGAPAATGAYGAAAGTYGGAAAAQPRYDEPTGMYRPDDQNYGGYQPEPEYPPAGRGRPEPTGAYQAGGYPEPEPADQGYDQWDNAPGGGNGNAYGPGATYGAGGAGAAYGGGGYGEQQQYGGDQGGYPADGYGAPSAAGGTYGAPPPAPAGGGYEGGGYGGDQGGYDPRATYGRPEGYDRGPEPGTYGGAAQPPAPPRGAQPGGYGDQGGYYGGDQAQGGPGGGRHGGPPARPQEPGQRRSLDWLDD